MTKKTLLPSAQELKAAGWGGLVKAMRKNPSAFKAPTEQALIRRINHQLPEHHQLHKARAHQQRDLGTYYVVDHYTNTIVNTHIDDLKKFLAA